MPKKEQPEIVESDDSATAETNSEETQVEETKSAETAEAFLSNIFAESCEANEAIMQGLKNLDSIADFSPETPPVKGKKFVAGMMGFRPTKSRLSLAIACGTAQVRYLDLPKFIAMVENMHDPVSSTIMLQNFQDQDDYKSAKGQVLGRINPESSAIHIIQGLTGRIIHNPSDIALFDVYYIDRVVLTTFYLAAKAQIGNTDDLEAMIATYDGWKAFNVPLDPLNPYKS